MNVLPVLVDLSPPSKLDLQTQGIGSSVGDFARILDRALSGTPTSGGTAAKSTTPNEPYLSPTRQSPRHEPKPPESERQQQAASDAASSGETPKPEHSTAPPAKHHSASNRDSSSAHGDGTGKAEKTRHPNDKTKSSSDRPAKKGHVANAKKKSPSPVDQTTTKKAEKDGNNRSRTAGSSARLPFPGALILAGAQKGVSGTRAPSKSNQPPAKPGIAVSLLKGEGSSTAKKSKQTTTVESGHDHKTKEASAKGAKAKVKPVPGSQTVPSQLLAAQLTNAATVAAPHSTATHTGPGYSNIQHDPANAAGHSGTANQAAAVTIVDLRQHNQGSSGSTGQNGSQNHSSDGANVRLFQIADGSAGGSVKMNGQAGMARAAGAPAAGQSFSALTDQIVRQTGILLKDNNSGEIRLVLKPEKLGNLRIKLDLNNNNLSGKIFVQNHEALKLVQQNLDSLYRALRESGFTATELNVSVGGRDNGERNRERSSPLPSTRSIGSVKGFDNQTPALETAGSYYSLVNLVI